MNNKFEKIVLGMILIDDLAPKNLIMAQILGLKPDHFMERRQNIFLEIINQNDKGNKFDVGSLYGILDKKDWEEASTCIVESPVTQNFSFWVLELIKENWKLKSGLKLTELAKKVSNAKEFDPIEPLIAEISETSFNLVNVDHASETKSVENISTSYLDLIEKRIIDFKSGRKQGIMSGIKKLDEKIQGFSNGRFYVLGARTSLGKTTLAINFANEAMRQNKYVLFFTVEMTGLEIFEKHVSLVSGVNNENIFSGNLREDEIDLIAEALRKLNKLPGFINCRFQRSIQNIENEAKILKRANKLDFLIVDYIGQLTVLGAEYKNRQQELTEITARLQSLALELDIPILGLAQINRQAEDFDMPQLFHLKDSGSIEQDASVVMFLYRAHGEEDQSRINFAILKNRYGGLGKFELGFNGPTNRFFDV